MAKPPSRIVSFESCLNALINAVANREVDIKANRKLLVKIRVERGAVEVTKGLDKGVDSKMGTSEAGIVI